MSAVARSLIYAAAMARGNRQHELGVVLVEIAYITLTAGVYAGMQQQALGLRRRWLGNAIIVFGVPGLAQALDWAAHYVLGATAPTRATLAVCCFAAISALFHLHVMRNGAFLSGYGRSLLSDFRRMPRLIAGFVLRPLALIGLPAAVLPEGSD